MRRRWQGRTLVTWLRRSSCTHRPRPAGVASPRTEVFSASLTTCGIWPSSYAASASTPTTCGLTTRNSSSGAGAGRRCGSSYSRTCALSATAGRPPAPLHVQTLVLLTLLTTANAATEEAEGPRPRAAKVPCRWCSNWRRTPVGHIRVASSTPLSACSPPAGRSTPAPSNPSGAATAGGSNRARSARLNSPSHALSTRLLRPDAHQPQMSSLRF